jgi:hypothetical protein
MNAMTFDTLAAAKRIEAAGLDRATAEAVVTEIAAAQVELFAKADGVALKGELLTEIANTKADTLKWVIGMMVVIVGAGNSLLYFALKH